MRELTLGYKSGQWLVQVFNDENCAIQRQFEYFIAPSPVNAKLGFIVERYAGHTTSRILCYDLSKYRTHDDGSFKYCQLAELAKFDINTAAEIRMPVGLNLSMKEIIQIAEHWYEVCNIDFIPQEEIAWSTFNQYMDACANVNLRMNHKQAKAIQTYQEQQLTNAFANPRYARASIEVAM